MKNFTVDSLVKAIRDADDLGDLKRLVGASEQEIERSAQRIAEIDRLWDKYGTDMPYHVEIRYKALMQEQDVFESNFA